MKKALVLSGGGARGAYQVGVWKALNELGEKFDIVTGTSVGSLNGAMYVQGTYEEAKELWNRIDYKEVFSDPFFKEEKSKKRTNIIIKYFKSLLKKDKLDANSLKANIENLIDYKTFYNSNIDYGLVVYNFDKKEPLMITKKDLKKEQLSDYLVASSTVYPIFEKKKIDEHNYVDGGYYDNLPINLAIKMGANEVVAVYIGVFGIRKPITNKDVKVTYIKPRSKLGLPFRFNNTYASRNMKLGYNDTMKIYKKFDGKYYTFDKNELKDEYNKYKDLLNKNIKKYKIANNLKKDKVSYNDFVDSIEMLGKLFNLNESKVYSLNYYLEKVSAHYISKEFKNVFTFRKASKMKNIYDKLDSVNNSRGKQKINKANFNLVIASIYLKNTID